MKKPVSVFCVCRFRSEVEEHRLIRHQSERTRPTKFSDCPRG